MSLRLFAVIAALAAPASAFAWKGSVFIDCQDFEVLKSSSPDPLKLEVFEAGWEKKGDDDYGRVWNRVVSEKVNLQEAFPNPLDPASCPIGSVGWLPLGRFSTSKSVFRVQLTATGNNAIWLDRLMVVADETITPYTQGVDGKEGWCLSTDSDDSFGSDRQDGRCKKSVKWDMSLQYKNIVGFEL
jgi:hypothetical protein